MNDEVIAEPLTIELTADLAEIEDFREPILVDLICDSSFVNNISVGLTGVVVTPLPTDKGSLIGFSNKVIFPKLTSSNFISGKRERYFSANLSKLVFDVSNAFCFPIQ